MFANSKKVTTFAPAIEREILDKKDGPFVYRLGRKIFNEEDCGTLRGLTATAIKRNDDVVQTLYDRILGRTALNDVIHPLTGEVICKAGEEITESIAEAIEKSPLESVEIRSVLTCEARRGVCAKCYGRNLATARMVQKGEVVGVIAAQSIGEPGTQLTLRTFHVEIGRAHV